MKKFLQLLLLCTSAIASGQKQALDSSAYDTWKSINQTVISGDGDFVAFVINPQLGDGWLYLYNSLTGKKDSVARGSGPSFSPDSKYLAYQILPKYTETRQAKKKKLKPDQMPKSNLRIMKLPSNEIVSISRVKSFTVPEKDSYWMAYLHEKKIPEKQDSVQKNDSTGAKKEKKGKTPEAKGTEFVIINPVTDKEFRFPDVTEYVVAKDGGSISFIQEIPDTSKIDNFKVNFFNTGKERNEVIFEGKGSLKKIATDKSGEIISFIYTSDTSKTRIYDLWISRSGSPAKLAVDTSNKAMPHGWAVSENGNFIFSADGSRLFFGTAAKPVAAPEDTLLEEEKYKLDIWSWDDDLLQPMQKKQLDQELKRTYQAVYHTGKNVMLQLGDSLIASVRVNPEINAGYVLGSSNNEYRKMSSWESRNYADYYAINVETGLKTKVLPKHPSQVILSPSGKYILSWDQDKRFWILMSVNGTMLKTISLPGELPLYNELHDTPSDPSPYGFAGWTEGDEHVLIYDNFDIWSVKTGGQDAPVNITNGFGRKNKVRFRYLKLDPDAEYIPSKEILCLSAFNDVNKEAGFYTARLNKNTDPVKLIFEKASFMRGVTKARNAGKIIWQKESFAVSPELYLSDADFSIARKLSVTNPQQNLYNWVRAELVEWESFDKQKLQGILYKPEDFDPARKYPLIVYFYERSSDGLYSYFPAAPSASIINRSFAVSNGYLLFVPDIPYKTGYPGQSCYDAVVSGTYSLIEKYNFIDKQRLGLDGQSWGGYQIAWLVTRTDLFRCAYAGAPVSNMISAYGGIRWETGMSRMFQYEHTQSRIGGTLWDKPGLFVENSPIFFVPRINTPLLIMHNDADGAVPWYQGIELITALRRLDKPAWLLSYNDEAHNLVKRPNRKDLSVRKMQFFDHYLKGAPMPYWMKYGITQAEKGKKDGYELVKD